MRVARVCSPSALAGCAFFWCRVRTARDGCHRAGAAAQRRPIVYSVEVDGIIHPVATEYIRRAIAQADAAKADLLVIVLRTPGGLVDSTRDINTAIIQSKTPVAVFVALRAVARRRQDF